MNNSWHLSKIKAYSHSWKSFAQKKKKKKYWNSNLSITKQYLVRLFYILDTIDSFVNSYMFICAFKVLNKKKIQDMEWSNVT